jgi:hypothetical protein
MNLRPAPRIPTWILTLLCAASDRDEVIGDLTEQYQRGRGAIWYWHQALFVVFTGLYRQAAATRITVGAGVSLILTAAALWVILLTPIWRILLVPVLGGVLVGVVMSLMSRLRPAALPDLESSTFELPTLVRIDSSTIPVRGGIGAGILVAVLLGGVLADLPTLRLLALPGIFGGLLFAVVLRVWRRGEGSASSGTVLGLQSGRVGSEPTR